VADIITNVDFGHFNRDLWATNARLSAEGMWKKQRIAWIIPGGAKIDPEVYIAHRSLVFPPNQAMTPIYVRNAEVGHAFDESINACLDHPDIKQWEYILTIESDNIPQPNGVLQLIKAMEKNPQFDAISGLYFTKGEGGQPQIWGDINDPVENYRPQPPVPGKVIECWGIGMGFVLYRMAMFHKLKERKVPRPWFKTLGREPEDKGVGTQDLYFWGRVARPNGFRCAVDCDTLVGHFDNRTGIVW
jgi:hypothetical protein